MKLTVAELKKTNVKYKENIQMWKLYMAAYKGINAIIRGKYIPQHEREEDTAYTRRMADLYALGYSKSVVNIFTFHLFNKPPQGRKLKDLDSNEFWTMFFDDANLYGDSYDTTMASLALYASIQGHMGILVDKSPGKFANLAEQKEARVYPYIATYHPPAILDWEWSKDENNRPVLAMVKLLDEDGRYRLWTLKEWGIFNIKDEAGEIRADQEVIEADQTGANPLGFIPFLWYYNIKSDVNAIGESDLTEIGKIDISLIKNASQVEEVINYAAFPMLMRPFRNAKPDVVAGTQQEDVVGTKAVVEYDPEYPESKPEWLTPAVQEAIDSILNTMKFKIGEIYRAANIGGLAGTEIQTQAKSGTALAAEFQILNASLVSKALNLEKAENRILEFWLKWENMWDAFKEKVNFGRSKSFDVENIAVDLANALTAKTVVMSKTFNGMLQKQTARQVLPSMSEDDRGVVDQEIDDYIEKTPEPGEVPDKVTNINNAPGEDTDIINKGMQED
ncbi:MAG: hypothetical protein PF503_06300 [Desulfobacula sp.]|nr:hypothetical protein [Desulfobacula sp.]